MTNPLPEIPLKFLISNISISVYYNLILKVALMDGQQSYVTTHTHGVTSDFDITPCIQTWNDSFDLINL